jgi:hypothetical protein
MTESKDILKQGDLVLRCGRLVSDWFAFNYTGTFSFLFNKVSELSLMAILYNTNTNMKQMSY